MKRCAALGAFALLAACGHGRPPDGGGRGSARKDAGAADGQAATPIDATALDATPQDAGPTFPPEFSRIRDQPACDPRLPDRDNPNCCSPTSCLQRRCSFDIVEVFPEQHNGKTMVALDAGWDQLLISGQFGYFLDEQGHIAKGAGLRIVRIRADEAWATTEKAPAVANQFRRVMMFSGCPE